MRIEAGYLDVRPLDTEAMPQIMIENFDNLPDRIFVDCIGDLA